MSKLTIPSFYFPTTVLVVDDDVDFLKNVGMCLSGEKAIFNFYSDPKRALELLNNEHSFSGLVQDLVNLVDEEEFEHRVIDVNVRDLYLTMYNKKRFKKISTVVVDFHMPGMDGIEFCQSIKNPHIQKILLTSIVDETKAIDMLNQGLISAFVKKQSSNVIPSLNQSIAQAQNRYFLALSQIFNQVAEFSKDETALNDEAFITLFNKILKDTGAVEFYLTEMLGSFVFVDANGEHYGLMTKTKEQIMSILESSQSESAPLEVLEPIKKGKQLLCYHNEKNYFLPEGNVWEQYLFDAQKILGQKQYFCAHGRHMYDIRRDNLMPFNNYSY